MPLPFRLTTRVIAFASKLDLGRKPMDYGSAMCGPSMPQPKVWYPTLWLDGLEQPIDLPDSGKATIDYKVTRKTTTDTDGKKRHDASLEIRSIEPVEKDDGKKKSKLPGTAKQVKLSALKPGMITFGAPRGRSHRAVIFDDLCAFDARPRNGDGQFEPQADGAGPDPATMRAAYGPQLGAATAATGAVAGLGGTAAAALLLAKKLKGSGFRA